MRFVVIALAAIVGLGTAGAFEALLSHPPVREPVELTAPALAEERTQLACAPSRLHVVIAERDHDVVISGLLWEAGVPAQSRATFYWDEYAPRAFERAAAAAAADGVVPVTAPSHASELTVEWAASLLCR